MTPTESGKNFNERPTPSGQALDENGNVVSGQDYFAFGEIMRSYNNASVNDKYKFTEKERDTETNYDYFGARYYDSEIGRWLSVDPLADKYPGWSPYNYTMDSPLITIDPNGMDTLYFDSSGQYLPDQTRKGDGDHVGYYRDKDGNLVEFEFNDQSDAESILSSVTGKHKPNADKLKLFGISIGENSAGEGLVAINIALGKNYPISYPLAESQPLGKMDYVYQIGKIKPTVRKNVTVIDGIGYNNFDIGNYYWGKTMGKLGYTPSMAKFAAQIYEIVFKQRADHPTDQRAIGHGAREK